MTNKIIYCYCDTCNQRFRANYPTQAFCSMECRQKKKQKFDRKKKPDQSIMEIVRLADAEHLTYGQYCTKHGL